MVKLLGFVVGASFAALVLTSHTEPGDWDRFTGAVASWFHGAFGFGKEAVEGRPDDGIPKGGQPVGTDVPSIIIDPEPRIPRSLHAGESEDEADPVPATRFDPGQPVARLPDPDVPAIQWQAIWNPFRSERSAGGFARRLEKLTKRAYRVERLGPGVYQVMFAFADDADRLKGLSILEQHTGVSFEVPKP